MVCCCCCCCRCCCRCNRCCCCCCCCCQELMRTDQMCNEEKASHVVEAWPPLCWRQSKEHSLAQWFSTLFFIRGTYLTSEIKPALLKLCVATHLCCTSVALECRQKTPRLSNLWFMVKPHYSTHNLMQWNSVITNIILSQIGHFIAQINPVITALGYN